MISIRELAYPHCPCVRTRKYFQKNEVCGEDILLHVLGPFLKKIQRLRDDHKISGSHTGLPRKSSQLQFTLKFLGYLKGVRGVFEIVLAIAWYHVTFKIKLLRNCVYAKFTLIYQCKSINLSVFNLKPILKNEIF